MSVYFAKIKTLKGPIAQGTLRTSVVFAFRLIAQAGTLLLLARLLGPTQWGAFAGMSALAVLLGTLPNMGSNILLLREVARGAERRLLILPWAIPMTLLCGGLLLAVFIILNFTVLAVLNIDWRVVLAIGFAEFYLQPLLTLKTSEQHALGRVAYAQWLQMIPLALRTTAALGLFLLPMPEPLFAYSAAYFLASALPLIFLLRLSENNWPSFRFWRLARWRELKETAGYAALNLSNLGPSELDKTLATKLLPLHEAGLYAAGARVIGAVCLPVLAMLLAALPRLFREAYSGRLINLVFISTLIYSLLIGGFLWLISPVFDILFGEEYQGISEGIRWLCFACPGLALRLASGHILMAQAKPWWRAGFEFFGAALLLLFSILFTQKLGLIGMPMAWAAAESLMAIIGWVSIIYLQVNKSVRL